MSVRSEGSRHSSVVSLISAYCADDDPNTRKFASFAGNNKYKLDSVCTTFIVVLFYNVFNFDALICVTSCVCIYSGKCCISFEWVVFALIWLPPAALHCTPRSRREDPGQCSRGHREPHPERSGPLSGDGGAAHCGADAGDTAQWPWCGAEGESADTTRSMRTALSLFNFIYIYTWYILFVAEDCSIFPGNHGIPQPHQVGWQPLPPLTYRLCIINIHLIYTLYYIDRAYWVAEHLQWWRCSQHCERSTPKTSSFPSTSLASARNSSNNKATPLTNSSVSS